MKKRITYCLSFAFCLLPFFISAQDSKSLFQTANIYYEHKQYEEAEKMYSLLIKKDRKNANAFYNLGNTYYHLKQYPNAVLYYEKARKLQPDNKYILHNIDLTNNKLFSKIEFSKEFFVTKQLKNVVHTQSSESWSAYLIIAFWLSAVSLCIHFFIANKLLFRTGIVLFLCTVVFAYFTYTSYKSEHLQDYAIVMQQNAYLKKAPVESTNTTQPLQTGIKVEIIDTDKDWMKIKLPDDRTGWVEKNSLELI